MLCCLLITNVPEIADHAARCGVERIFLDLERHGKAERQGHLDSHITTAGFEDISPMCDAVGDQAELLVRVNPLHAGTPDEVERAVAGGADILMLPYFTAPDEVAQFCQMVAGRAAVVPLVETAQAAAALTEIVRIPGVSEIYIGLNDLHLSLGLDFMFQPLADGTVDGLASIARDAGLPFGFGGIARIGEGDLDARLILGEHLRLGSTRVILSRTFHNRSRSLEELTASVDLEAEMNSLRAAERALAGRSREAISADRQRLTDKVAEIVARRTVDRPRAAPVA